MEWGYILQKARIISERFYRAHKCLNVDRDTKKETLQKHLNTILETLEQIRVLFNANYFRLTKVHQTAAEAFFADLRTKTLLVCQKKRISVNIPESLHEHIEFKLDINAKAENKNILTMPQTIVEFLGTAAKILPTFDGNSVNLQSFIDALSLLDTIKDTHEAVAVNLVKTKLTGTARNLISTETTIADIIAKLKSTVKGESVEVIQSRILNIKQQGKNANAYAVEIEELTKRLETAYISDGLPNETAKKYATNSAVAAIVKNATNEKVKLIMESGNFKDMNEAVSKFLNCCTEAYNQQNAILAFGYQRPRRQNNNNQRYQRAQYYGGRGHYNNNQNRNYSHNNDYNPNTSNGRHNNNNRSQNNFRGNIRYNRGYNSNNNFNNRNHVRAVDSTGDTFENSEN